MRHSGGMATRPAARDVLLGRGGRPLVTSPPPLRPPPPSHPCRPHTPTPRGAETQRGSVTCPRTRSLCRTTLVQTQREPEACSLGTVASRAQRTLEPSWTTPSSYHRPENQPLPCHSQKVRPFRPRPAGATSGGVSGRAGVPGAPPHPEGSCHPQALGPYLALKRPPRPVTAKVEYIFKYRRRQKRSQANSCRGERFLALEEIQDAAEEKTGLTTHTWKRLHAHKSK